MSLATHTLSFLGIKPKVWVDGHRLLARTSLVWQLLSFFSYASTVIVDRQRLEVTVETRILWVMILVEKVPFSRVAGVGYRARTLPTSWSLFDGTLDRYEIINVSLELVNPRESLLLFRFMGDGSVKTGLSVVLWSGDSIIDFRGNQMETAQEYMELLEAFVGRKVVAL